MGAAIALVIGVGATLLWTQNRGTEDVALTAAAPATVARDDASSASRGDALSREEMARAMDEMNRRMAALASQVSSMKHAGGAAPGDVASSAGGAGARSTAGERGLSRAEREQRGHDHADAQAELIEQTASAEQVDRKWAIGAENTIRASFQSPALEGLKLVGAQCRSTVCRIDVAPVDSADGGENFDAGFRRLMIRTPWQGQGFGRVYDPFGPAPRGVLFLAREGQTLPEPASE
jgi:hypothetical protein